MSKNESTAEVSAGEAGEGGVTGGGEAELGAAGDAEEVEVGIAGGELALQLEHVGVEVLRFGGGVEGSAVDDDLHGDVAGVAGAVGMLEGDLGIAGGGVAGAAELSSVHHDGWGGQAELHQLDLHLAGCRGVSELIADAVGIDVGMAGDGEVNGSGSVVRREDRSGVGCGDTSPWRTRWPRETNGANSWCFFGVIMRINDFRE